MNFKRIAAGILACTMSVSLFGCELVSVNKERDNAQIVLTVGDKSYSKEMIRGISTTNLEMYGVENPEDKAYDEYRETVVETFAKQKAIQYYVIANGYADKLTEENEKEVNESYEATVKRYNEEILEKVKTDLGYTGEEGAPEIDEAAQLKIDKRVAEEQKAYLMQIGVNSIEEYKDELIASKAVEVYNKTFEESISVSDDEVKNAFNAKLDEQKSSYDKNPTNYITAVEGGEDIWYTPAGFRRVKNLLIKIDNAEYEEIAKLKNEVEEMKDGEEKTAKQAELEALQQTAFSKIEEKANQVYQRASNGENFDKLIEEFGEDTGTQTQPEGYLMHANALGKYVNEFQQAGMALAKPGDMSELVKTVYGYHILLYASDVEAYEKPFESVAETMKQELLEEKKTKAVETKANEVFEGYKADGTVKIYLDRLKTASVPGKK